MGTEFSTGNSEAPPSEVGQLIRWYPVFRGELYFVPQHPTFKQLGFL